MAKIRSTVDMFTKGQTVGRRFDKQNNWTGTVVAINHKRGTVDVRWKGHKHVTHGFLANELELQ